MQKPDYYAKKAAHRRGGALICALFMTYAAAALSFALANGSPRAAIAAGAALVLIAALGLRLMALARRFDHRALTEEYFRSKEAKTSAVPVYPLNPQSPWQP